MCDLSIFFLPKGSSILADVGSAQQENIGKAFCTSLLCQQDCFLGNSTYVVYGREEGSTGYTWLQGMLT